MLGWKSKAIKANHWAVIVDDKRYEVEQTEKNMDIKSGTEKKEDNKKPTLTLAGDTDKSDDEIDAENMKWKASHPSYCLFSANCQAYTVHMAKFLVGGSYEPPCPLPQAGVAGWCSGAASHTVESQGVSSYKWTAGRAGAIVTIFGVDAEGPKFARGGSIQDYGGNNGSYFEASLFRLEAKVYGLRGRIEVNANTGLGYRDGQLQAKLAGFGVSFGNNGIGLSTPFGGVGLGKF